MTVERTALLFPGHGGYVAGVLRELNPWPASVAATFEAVDATCAEAGVAPVGQLVRSENAPGIRELLRSSPGSISLTIFGVGVAMFKILTEAGVRPALLIGHSFAEITALTCAGGYSVEDGARVLHARNNALRGLALAETGMLAVELSAERAQALVDLVGDPYLHVACVNAPRQSVLSGTAQALRLVQAVTDQLELRSTPLSTPIAFHNPLLAAAVPTFCERVAAIPRRPLNLPVYSPVERRRYEPDEELAPIIARNFLRPVLFADALRAAHAGGVQTFVQCGPSATLTKMAEQTLPAITTFAPFARAEGAEERLSGLVATLAHEPAIGAATVVPAPRAVSAEHQQPPVASPPPVTDSASSPVPATGSTTTSSAAQVSAELRELYASTLGFPEELFTDEVEFEADLGIDSVKRTELLSRAVRRFDLAGGVGANDYTTFGQVVDMITSELQSRGRPAGV